MIKYVIFDFGGVVHSLSKTSSTQRIADLYGLSVDDVKPHTKELGLKMGLGEIDEEEFWRDLSLRLDRKTPKDYRSVWHDKTTEEFEIFPEIIELTKYLAKKGLKNVVLSNTIPPHIEFSTNNGWYDYFDKVYLSPIIGLRKPDIRAYRYVLDDLHTQGEECVFIDDREENLIPARELGMKVVLAKNPKQVVDEIKSLINRGEVG